MKNCQNLTKIKLQRGKEEFSEAMKIAVIGCGNVGAASAYACALRGVGTELVLVDHNPDLAVAQAEDILHATPFAKTMPVYAGSIEDIHGSGIVMVAAGVNQKPGETRLDLLKRNAEIFNTIIPKIVAAAPEAILIIATNPVDIMTHLATEAAVRTGHPATHVIGSGTILDTARFRSLLANHLKVSSHSVHAHVLGEHGDSEVLHWSGASISNIEVCHFAEQMGASLTAEVKAKIDDSVRNAAYSIIRGKGATWFGIGAGMARIAQAITEDENAVLTCSATMTDLWGFDKITLSLPRIVSSQGMIKTLYPQLEKEEESALRKSAEVLATALSQVS